MATYEHNALMQYIDETGNMHINYPATKAENVMMGGSNAQIEITARAKTSDVLYTLEEISACTDFTNKISGAEAVNEVNSNLNSKNRTFTLANTIENGTIALVDNFRYYTFLDVLLITNDDHFISSIYIPTELINNGFHIYPSYTSDSQTVVYITIVNGTTIVCNNNGNGKRVILVGIDKKN